MQWIRLHKIWEDMGFYWPVFYHILPYLEECWSLKSCILAYFMQCELGQVCFHSTFLVKLQGCSQRSFKSLKQLYSDWFCMTASNVWTWIDTLKYQLLMLQNKKVGDEKQKYFPKSLIYKINYNSKTILTCYDM